jgi:hypothetical protein
MKYNAFYVISQKNTVNKEIFAKDADEYFSDDKDYKIPGTSQIYTHTQ